ncbi:MAG: DUF3368 domain-containing protein, partial [Cyanobacteria bacterium J06639_1]
MIVVSNTTPIHCLLQIGEIELLRELFQTIVIPNAVVKELSDPLAPDAVREWISAPPDWVRVLAVEESYLPENVRLDPGESEAIVLAFQLQADLVLLDETKARRVAKQEGLSVSGTLGVLDRAALMGCVDLKRVAHTPS